MSDIKFFREAPSQIFNEVLPILVAHFRETYTVVRPDLVMKPDFAAYEAMEKAGTYKLFTIRNAFGELLGYAGFYFRTHPHAETIMAIQDLIYIKREHRGIGKDFIPFCEQELKKDGATYITQAVRPSHDFSSMLVRQGYEIEEKIYVKKL